MVVFLEGWWQIVSVYNLIRLTSRKHCIERWSKNAFREISVNVSLDPEYSDYIGLSINNSYLLTNSTISTNAWSQNGINTKAGLFQTYWYHDKLGLKYNRKCCDLCFASGAMSRRHIFTWKWLSRSCGIIQGYFTSVKTNIICLICMHHSPLSVLQLPP